MVDRSQTKTTASSFASSVSYSAFVTLRIIVGGVSLARSVRKESEMKNRILPSVAGLLCCGFCLMLSNKLLAQAPELKLQQLSQALNLSAQQKGEMLPILQEEGPKLEAIKNNPNLTGAQKAMQLRAIHKQTDPQVKTILSPQQYQEWQAIRQHEIEQAMKRKTEGSE
jgi:hypothetical protein